MTAVELAQMIRNSFRNNRIFDSVEILAEEPNVIGFELETGIEFSVTVEEA